MRKVNAPAAKAMVHAGRALAFLDVREAGQFGEGHPLFAVPCPYSRFEARVAQLVPRGDHTVLLIDGDDGVAEDAAHRLQSLGYRHIAVVEGGVAAWRQAGFTLFKGVNVVSKTLGELAEQVWHPQTVEAVTLREWQAEDAADIYDARSASEFAKMHVPGAVCLPNGELAYRLDALPQPPGRRLVVGCAGRTRGIIGAVGLRLMGHDGPLYALENGTQGWALAGLALERGVKAGPFPSLHARARKAAQKRAEAFLRRWRISTVDASNVRHLLEEPDRATFLFDVRSEAEAQTDPIAAAIHAPSGQLVQATDQYVGVMHARLILCDDIGVRAGLAAFWLRQLGYDPLVVRVDGSLKFLPKRCGTNPGVCVAIPRVEPRPALAQLQSGVALLVDLRASRAYRQSHVRGAVWSTRVKLVQAVGNERRRILLVADDEEVLAGAACELSDSDHPDFAAVSGGHDALVAEGADMERTPSLPADAEAIDFLRFLHDRHEGNLEASRDYLAWERGLVNQLDADERGEFRLERPQQ